MNLKALSSPCSLCFIWESRAVPFEDFIMVRNMCLVHPSLLLYCIQIVDEACHASLFFDSAFSWPNTFLFHCTGIKSRNLLTSEFGLSSVQSEFSMIAETWSLIL